MDSIMSILPKIPLKFGLKENVYFGYILKVIAKKVNRTYLNGFQCENEKCDYKNERIPIYNIIGGFCAHCGKPLIKVEEVREIYPPVLEQLSLPLGLKSFHAEKGMLVPNVRYYIDPDRRCHIEKIVPEELLNDMSKGLKKLISEKADKIRAMDDIEEVIEFIGVYFYRD